MHDFKLLAGPIVRRADTRRVFFWIATDTQVSIEARIFIVSEPLKPGDKLEAIDIDSDEHAGTRSVCLGERFFITLIAAQPKSGEFPMDRLLAYDLILNGKSLGDLKLLSGPQRITYDSLPLPTFFLPKETTSLLHGSCRNLGGTGLDALPDGDALLEEHYSNLSIRPSLLILDGDQIYADHMPAPLIHHLTQMGNALLGWEETIPGIVSRLIELPVNGRQKLAADKACFTSGGAQNQLMALGEFAALYLLAWNIENWPDVLPPYPKADHSEGVHLFHKVGDIGKSLLSSIERTPEQAYKEMVENLETVRKGVPAVRRLLANIPTYMIFDDHDVTDDLFITRKWKKDVWNSETGRRVVANGLAAAWAFQCWGNDPDRFPQDFVAAISDHLQAQAQDGSLTSAFEEKVWNFPEWTYSLPVQPTTIVMNTRTQRGYDSDEGAARLINQEGLEVIRWSAMRAGYQRGDPLILVSPTPVIGYETVEGMQERVSRYIGPYTFDLESWRANLDGYISLFKFIISELAPQYVIFLSGDVHYGFTISASFTWQGISLPVIQLTSSALKNSGMALEVIGISSLFAGRTDRQFGWEQLVSDVNEFDDSSYSMPSMPHPGDGDPKSTRKEGRTVHILPGEKAPMPANFSAVSGILEASGPVQGRLEWHDSRTFEPAWGFRSLPIIGENNLGLVRFQSDGLLVHRLLIPTEAGARSSTAMVATTPGKVVLKRISNSHSDSDHDGVGMS
jgi:hypothetical protein